MPPKKASKKDAVAAVEAPAADVPASPPKPVTGDLKSPSSPAKKSSPEKKPAAAAKKPAATKEKKEPKPKAAAPKKAAAAPKKTPVKKEKEGDASSGAESSPTKKKPAAKKAAAAPSSGNESSPKKSVAAEKPAKKKPAAKKAAAATASSGNESSSSPKKSAGEASPKKKPAAKKRTKAEAEENGVATTAEGSSPAKKAKASPKKKPAATKAEKPKAAAKPKKTKAESGAESSAAEGAGSPKKKAVKKKATPAAASDEAGAAPAKKSKKKAAAPKEGEEAKPAKEKKPAKPRAKKPTPVEDEAPVVGERKGFTPLPTAMPKLIKKTIAPKRSRPATTGEEDEAASVDGEQPGGPEQKSSKVTKKGDTTSKKLMNATETDWENQEFQINRGFKLKVASWNVSGLRAWLEKGGKNYILHERPDIVCLQETKCKPDIIPPEATISGYHPYWLGFSGQAGVGIYSRQMPLNVTYGIGDKEMDEEGRLMTAEYEKFFLVNVYVPNAGRKLVTLPKRLRWNKLFKEYIEELDKKKAVIICGDLNVAHEEIDLANPKSNKKNAGFTQEERDGLTEFLSDSQFVDTFRHFYPKEKDAYTFWTYMSNARAKNVGWRLDYILVSQRIIDKVVDNKIRAKVFGSDHCPIVGFFNL